MAYLKSLIISLFAVFAPIKAVLATTLLLVAVDLITGLIAAYKRKEAITSAGFRRTASKLLVYEVAVMLAFLTETYLTGEMAPLCKIVTAFIGVTELKSCLENMDTISGGSIIKTLLKKLDSDNANKQ